MAPSRKHDKSFVCGHCDKKLSGDRSRHIKLHSADKDSLKWSCAACGFGDLQKHNVVQHYIRTHTTDRPYECDQRTLDSRGHATSCSFKCQSSSVLTKHRRDVHHYNPKEEKRDSATRSRKLQAYEQFVVPPRSHFDGPAVPAPSRSHSSSTTHATGKVSSASLPSASRPAPAATPLVSFPISPKSYPAPQYPTLDPALAFQASFSQLPDLYHPMIKSEPLEFGGTSFMTPDFNTWAQGQGQYGYAPQQVFVPHVQTAMPSQPGWSAYQMPSHFGHSASHW